MAPLNLDRLFIFKGCPASLTCKYRTFKKMQQNSFKVTQCEVTPVLACRCSGGPVEVLGLVGYSEDGLRNVW
jgi:hypothetical protein